MLAYGTEGQRAGGRYRATQKGRSQEAAPQGLRCDWFSCTSPPASSKVTELMTALPEPSVSGMNDQDEPETRQELRPSPKTQQGFLVWGRLEAAETQQCEDTGCPPPPGKAAFLITSL